MTTPQSCARLAALVRYPDATFPDALAATADILDGSPAAAALLRQFSTEVSGVSLGELQEIYTRTFDLNPVCPLEIGWHLFGEDYQRGAFMVRMREALAQSGIAESGELPDHLSCALRLVSEGPHGGATPGLDEIRRALSKMIEALDAAPGPYRHLLRAVDAVLIDCLQEAPHA
jgi:nitrate reductase delta subunit